MLRRYVALELRQLREATGLVDAARKGRDWWIPFKGTAQAGEFDA